MHTFDTKTGWSLFEFTASCCEPVWLVGDFNNWGRRPLPMRFEGGRWRLRVKLQAGCYDYAFQVRDGFYAPGVAEVPLWFGRMTDKWMERAVDTCTCGSHFWKWN